MRVNRFYILFALWALLLGRCVANENVYVNALILFFGFLFLVCALAYVVENINDIEKNFTKKLENIF
jgi:4-hydroxybenzoate polyprenyltransferase